jgi:hypothetical protein
MDIPGGEPEKFFEDLLLILFRDARSVVNNLY